MKANIYPNTNTEDYILGYNAGFNEGHNNGYISGYEAASLLYKEKIAKLSATIFGLSDDLEKFLDSQE